MFPTTLYSYYWPKCTASTTGWSMGMRTAPCAVHTGSNRLRTDCRHLVISCCTPPITDVQTLPLQANDLKVSVGHLSSEISKACSGNSRRGREKKTRCSRSSPARLTHRRCRKPRYLTINAACECALATEGGLAVNSWAL